MRFDIERSERPLDEDRRRAVLKAPKFGQTFSDHMVTVDYDPNQGWHNGRVRPLAPLQLHPGTAALHYAQEVFEGMKAYRRDDNTIVLFRVDRHAQRLNDSLQRMSMPVLPEGMLAEALDALLAADGTWVPDGPHRSLYLRPFVFATDSALGGSRPSKNYMFVLIASPTTSTYSTETAMSVWLCKNYVRATAGGTGAAKAGANYAGALLGLQEAEANGCDQAIWLDAKERRYVEEAGAMNLFFVYGNGPDARLVTPELTGTFLPGITRDSILQLAPTLGFRVDTGHVSIDQWRDDALSGAITETFACGTAAIVVNIGEVRAENEKFLIADGKPPSNSIAVQLRDALLGIQFGSRPDPFGWIRLVDQPATAATT